jgi:hypothetical protein
LNIKWGFRYIRIEVFTVVRVQIMVLWVVNCSLNWNHTTEAFVRKGTVQSRSGTLSPLQYVRLPRKDPDSVAFLVFVHTIFSHIGWVLLKHNIKVMCIPSRKICFLHPIKNDLGLKKRHMQMWEGIRWTSLSVQ